VFDVSVGSDAGAVTEFGSVTFLLVSWLMALANHVMRRETGSSAWLTSAAMAGLGAATVLILLYEATTHPRDLAFIVGLYAALSLAAWAYSTRRPVECR